MYHFHFTLFGDCPPCCCEVTAWILSLCKPACLVACWQLQNICMLLSRGSNSLGKIPHSATNNHRQCFHPRTSDHLDLAPQFHHFSCCRMFAANRCPHISTHMKDTGNQVASTPWNIFRIERKDYVRSRSESLSSGKSQSGHPPHFNRDHLQGLEFWENSPHWDATRWLRSSLIMTWRNAPHSARCQIPTWFTDVANLFWETVTREVLWPRGSFWLEHRGWRGVVITCVPCVVLVPS